METSFEDAEVVKLVHWAETNFANGCTEKQLVDVLASEGRPEAIISRIIRGSKREVAQRRVPEPSISGSPTTIYVGGHPVAVQMALRFPRIVLFNNFLTYEECDTMIWNARKSVSKSTVVDHNTGASVEHAARTSSGTHFAKHLNSFVETIDQRIADLLNWPLEWGESLQVLKYDVGQEYKPHHDYFSPTTSGDNMHHITKGGQRVATFIMYLNTPERGGGTVFPDIGLEVTPSAGSALFFSYPNLFYGKNTLHGGTPVIAGEKWIATKWLREREF